MDNSKTQVSMNEYLSALLDDEAGSFEQKRVLDELKSSDELRRKLSSYSLIGETMRLGELDKTVVCASTNFLSGIHAKIEKEDLYDQVQVGTSLQNHAENRTSSKSWLRPVRGFAMAASVAVIAVIGFQNFNNFNQLGIETASNSLSSPKTIALNQQKVQLSENEMNSAIEVPADTLEVDNNDHYQQADLHARSLLKRYVDSHMQYASTAAFVPSVRAIAYADNK